MTHPVHKEDGVDVDFNFTHAVKEKETNMDNLLETVTNE